MENLLNEERCRSSIIYNRAITEMANIPKEGLNRALYAVRSGTLRIAYVGDSIVEACDQLKISDAFPSLLDNSIKNALPEVNIVSKVMALGGRTSSNFVDPAFIGISEAKSLLPASCGFYRHWSTIGKSWVDSVEEFAPDLLIIGFGMNDAAAGAESDEIVANNILSIIHMTNSWSVVPSLVLIPTILPTKDRTRYFQTQSATKAVARATRETAIANKVVVADANRLFQILRDGKDDVSRQSFIETNWEGYDELLWTGNKSNYILNGNILTPSSSASNKFITRNKDFYNGSIQFDFKAMLPTDWAWIDYRKDPDCVQGGMILFIQPDSGVISLYSSTDNGVPLASAYGLSLAPKTFHNIKIEVDGVRHRIYLNGVSIIDTVVYKKFNDGYISIGSNQSSVIYANLSIIYCDPIESEITYTEDELLGAPDSIQSGNGINHPTGLGHQLFYLPSFNGVVRFLSSGLLQNSANRYDSDYTNFKDNIGIGVTVDLFSIAFGDGQWKNIFIEVSGSGMMSGVAGRIVTSRYHLNWSNTDGVWTRLDNFTNGTQLSLITTDGRLPKISAVTGGSAGGSNLKVNMRIVGDPSEFVVTSL